MNFIKKNVPFLIIALFFVMFTAASCSKDDDPKPSLVGTSWKWNGILKDEAELTYTFPTETTYSWVLKEAGFDDASGSGTYTYSNPTVTFTEPDGDTFTGIVNESTLVISGKTYTKQ